MAIVYAPPDQNTGNICKRHPIERRHPDRPARPIPGLYTPRPGDRITVQRNLAPFWSETCFGESLTLDVVRVRDVYEHPMTLGEFAGLHHPEHWPPLD